MKKLLIIGGGILQVPVIIKAKEMGIYTVVADGNPDALGLAIADKSYFVDIVDPKELLLIALDERINGVIHPCSEIAMFAMGTINDEMNLKGVGLQTSIRATNKEKMRRAFEANNAPSPKSIGAYSEKEALKAANDISNDIIIKPSRNSGSRGVTYLPGNALEKEIRMAFNRAMENSFDQSVVIEEFIIGPEFSVEIVIWDNEPHVLAVTDKLTTGCPYFVELGHSQPSQFSKQELAVIENAAIAGCKALELDWCAAHAEIKLQDGNPYLMEIGARLGGDFISTELVHLSTGIDMVAAAIDLALGQTPDITPKFILQQGVAIRYFTPPVAGKLTKLEIANILKENPQVSQLDIYKKVGDIIPNLYSSLDRSGHVITTGKDAKEAIKIAEWILNNIVYEIE